MKLHALVNYLDKLLRVREISDDSQNGLQVDGAADVRRIAFAVDARLAAFEQAAALGAQMVIVHHGLCWGAPLRLTGVLHQRLRVLFENRISLYGVHLPLDMHVKYGNNAALAKIIGLKQPAPAGEYHGITIGMGGVLPRATSLRQIAAQIAKATCSPITRMHDACIPPKRVLCVSGGASDMAQLAADSGYDTFVTGETSHSRQPLIEELPLNVIFGGHYATETLGLKSLARHINTKFRLPTEFISLPTGI